MQFDYFGVMTQAQKGYSRYLEPVCREWGLTRNELDVLLFLANNPKFDRAVDIVTHRGMAKSHVSLSVSTLEAKGLLTRREDPEDRRTIRLKLEEKALRVVEQGRQAQRAFFTKIHEGVSREEIEILRRISEKIGGNIRKMDA